jgi:hypothetical protein
MQKRIAELETTLEGIHDDLAHARSFELDDTVQDIINTIRGILVEVQDDTKSI